MFTVQPSAVLRVPMRSDWPCRARLQCWAVCGISVPSCVSVALELASAVGTRTGAIYGAVLLYSLESSMPRCILAVRYIHHINNI